MLFIASVSRPRFPFEDDIRKRPSKVIFEDDLQLSLILSSLPPSFTHFLNSFLLIPLSLSLTLLFVSLSLSDMVMGLPFFLFCLCCLHHVVGAIDSFDFELSEWSSNASEGVGPVGAVIGVILFLGIIHFCWRWCHPAQSDQHANNSNLELGPPPKLP